MFKLKATAPIICDSPQSVPLTWKAGHIKFDNVCFTYPNSAGRSILNGVSMDIPAGSTVAIVGSSGSGLSCNLSLLVTWLLCCSLIVSSTMGLVLRVSVSSIAACGCAAVVCVRGCCAAMVYVRVWVRGCGCVCGCGCAAEEFAYEWQAVQLW